MLLRTAKSCGPDAPTLASSFANGKSAQPGADKSDIREMTVAKEPGHRGARHRPLKPLRAGMPGDPGGPVVLSTLHRGAAGAAGTRHSPRPQRGRKINARLGRIASRGREVASGIEPNNKHARRPGLEPGPIITG